MKAPKASRDSMRLSRSYMAIVATMLQLLFLVATVVTIRGKEAFTTEVTFENDQRDNSTWMPFVSVRERRSCLLVPKRKIQGVVEKIAVHITALEEADKTIMMSYVENGLAKLSSFSPKVLVEELLFSQRVTIVRKDEVQRFWDHPGHNLWLDCVYVMDPCSWDITLARLNNSGITLFETPFINHGESQPISNSPGTLCLAISKTILKTDLFRQRRPRVLVVNANQVTDLDIQLIAQGLPSMGQIVVIGKLTSTVQSMFEIHGFHVLEQENFFVAVLKPQILDSDRPDTTLHSIGKVANVYVANMDEDYSGRWAEARENFRTAGLDNLWPKHERFRAINGRKELAITTELRNLFRTDGFNVTNPNVGHCYRPGVLGCSATHILLWTKLSKRTDLSDLDSIIILEDDFYFAKDVADRWKRGPGHSLSMSDPRWDIMMLGFNDDPMFYPGIHVWDGVEAFPSTSRSFGYGTHGYMLRKRGARRLLNVFHKFGMPQGVDWFLAEAWIQEYIVAYKSVPWLVYSKSSIPGYGSRVERTYELSLTSDCPQHDQDKDSIKQNQREVFSNNTFARAKVELHPGNWPAAQTMQNVSFHPDLRLETAVDLLPGISPEEWSAKNPCAQFCLQYGHKNFSYPPPQCYFVFDNHLHDVYADPGRLQLGQETKIYAAVLTGDGQILQDSISEPLVVNTLSTIAHMEVHEVQHNQLALEVVVRHAPANFMSIHSSSLLCVNEHCDPLGSFPVDFNISVSSDEGVAVRATLQTLGSMRDLAVPIEHFYRTSSRRANPINVQAHLKGL